MNSDGKAILPEPRSVQKAISYQFLQRGNEPPPVCVIPEDRLAAVTPTHHMINRPRIFNSDLSRHAPNPTQPADNMSISRTDPFMNPTQKQFSLNRAASKSNSLSVKSMNAIAKLVRSVTGLSAKACSSTNVFKAPVVNRIQGRLASYPRSTQGSGSAASAWIALLSVATLILVGCSSPQSAKLSSSGAVPSGEAAVFGTVCLRHGEVGGVESASGRRGSPDTGGSGLLWVALDSALGGILGNPKTICITLIDCVKLNQVGTFKVSGTNTLFCWNLPPGRYAISDLTVQEKSIGVFTPSSEVAMNAYRVYGEFEVRSDLAPTYVGDLNLGLDDYSRLVGAGLRDDFNGSSERFRNAYPKVPGTPVKSLLQLEKKR